MFNRGKITNRLANPPFEVSDWSRRGGMRKDVRWKFGMPPVNNANYAWIQLIIHPLARRGGGIRPLQLGFSSRKGM